jgi:hypothetical protein
MGIFDWFRRPPPIDDRPGLLEFLDTRAAFLAQKGIFDFARATTGPHFYGLIKEKAFAEAVDRARWKSYPLTLSTVVEMVDGTLRPSAMGPMPLAEALQGAALEIIDRYPVPAVVGPDAWSAARDELALRVIQIAMHPPKAVKDIPFPIADQFFRNLPIHERMRGHDQTWVTNNLRANLIRMWEEFDKRADVAALADALGVAREAAAAALRG